MRTSQRYVPWLMNYLRANDVYGSSIPGYGGYPWPGAGLMFGPVDHTARMKALLRVIDAGTAHDQL